LLLQFSEERVVAPKLRLNKVIFKNNPSRAPHAKYPPFFISQKISKKLEIHQDQVTSLLFHPTSSLITCFSVKEEVRKLFHPTSFAYVRPEMICHESGPPHRRLYPAVEQINSSL
jgi:hypothetical protein